MTTIEAKVDAMARMMLGTTDEERAAARRTLCNLLDKPVLRDKESVVCEMLRDKGFSQTELIEDANLKPRMVWSRR